MKLNHSVKHSTGDYGMWGKMSQMPEGKWVKGGYLAPEDGPIVALAGESVLKSYNTLYTIHPATSFVFDYRSLPPGTVVTLTQE